MTEFEDIARQRLTIVERRMPERNRFFEGLLFALGLTAAAILGPWLFTVLMFSLQ